MLTSNRHFLPCRLLWYKEPTPEPVGDLATHLLGSVEAQKLIFMAPQVGHGSRQCMPFYGAQQQKSQRGTHLRIPHVPAAPRGMLPTCTCTALYAVVSCAQLGVDMVGVTRGCVRCRRPMMQCGRALMQHWQGAPPERRQILLER